MKYLGIDYGSKRTGLALSDEGGRIAFPHKVLPTNNQLLRYIDELCEKENVGAIVLGQSLNYKNEPNRIQSAIENFKLQIESLTNLPVHYQNEMLTSIEAARSTSKANLDASAAAIILQSYLDRENRV